jgi:hypothetical protein
MSHLTLQEVIDKINQAHSAASDRRSTEDEATDQKHRPEVSIPGITRRLARLMFSA